MLKKILLWALVICLSVTIFIFSAKTGTESSDISIKITEKTVNVAEKTVEIEEENQNDTFQAIHKVIRKGAHFLEFAVLAVLVFFLVKSYNLPFKMCILIALGYCLLFAISDEIHQLFVEGRRGMVLDVVLDFCGSFVGVLICYLPLKFRKK